LGTGTRLFADDGVFEKLRLVESVTTTTGVVIGTYTPMTVTGDEVAAARAAL
jgi:hypothetical protein